MQAITILITALAALTSALPSGTANAPTQPARRAITPADITPALTARMADSLQATVARTAASGALVARQDDDDCGPCLNGSQICTLCMINFYAYDCVVNAYTC